MSSFEILSICNIGIHNYDSKVKRINGRNVVVFDSVQQQLKCGEYLEFKKTMLLSKSSSEALNEALN